jgi:hypothetical protein
VYVDENLRVQIEGETICKTNLLNHATLLLRKHYVSNKKKKGYLCQITSKILHLCEQRPLANR